MTRSLSLSLCLSLASIFAAGCMDDQSYTPIGEENADEVCTQAEIDIQSRGSIALEVDEAGAATYDGTVDVTLFTRTEMRIETEEIIMSVPGNSLVTVDIEEGDWDLFTNMVFTVDTREAGTTAWHAVNVSKSSGPDLTWYTAIEFNGAALQGALSTLQPCSARSADINSLALPASVVSKDYELRIRAFPFEGYGDLVGTYDYTVNVAIR